MGGDEEEAKPLMLLGQHRKTCPDRTGSAGSVITERLQCRVHPEETCDRSHGGDPKQDPSGHRQRPALKIAIGVAATGGEKIEAENRAQGEQNHDARHPGDGVGPQFRLVKQKWGWGSGGWLLWTKLGGVGLCCNRRVGIP